MFQYAEYIGTVRRAAYLITNGLNAEYEIAAAAVCRVF